MSLHAFLRSVSLDCHVGPGWQKFFQSGFVVVVGSVSTSSRFPQPKAIFRAWTLIPGLYNSGAHASSSYSPNCRYNLRISHAVEPSPSPREEGGGRVVSGLRDTRARQGVCVIVWEHERFMWLLRESMGTRATTIPPMMEHRCEATIRPGQDGQLHEPRWGPHCMISLCLRFTTSRSCWGSRQGGTRSSGEPPRAPCRATTWEARVRGDHTRPMIRWWTV